MAAVDVNGDGIPDMIVATNQGVTVTFGNGDGTFGPPEGSSGVTYSTGGEYSESVAVVDVNGDGWPDIIVTNMCFGGPPVCNGVAVLLNNSNNPGTFLSAVGFNSGGDNTGAVAVGDVNGDGIPDLVLTSSCSIYSCVGGILTWLPGNGDGTFGASQDIAGVSGPVALGALNPNNPTVLDLVTSAGVLMNNGSGTFTPLPGNVVNGANSIALADINNDGILDVVAALGTGYISAALGNGDGTFQTAKNFKATGYFPLSVAVADVNGDGNPDVAVAMECTIIVAKKCSGAGAVSVLAGNGDGTFQTAVSFASGGDISTSVQLVDANGDTKPDIWVANTCGTSFTCDGDGSVGVLLNDYLAHTTLKITSSANPALIGQTVTLTATLGPSGSTVPNGTDIVFNDDGGYIGDNVTVNGATSITYAFPTAGGQVLTAVFEGDLYHAAVTGGLTEVIDKVPSMTVGMSSPSTSTYGQSVTLTATVSSNLATPTGTVIFKNGSALLGSATLNGSGVGT